jgi:VWFA-related protein
MPSPKIVTVAVCLSIAATALLAQQPTSQQPTFRASTQVVPVDVVVVDKDGKHVYGLKASDFELRDRRTRQQISVFAEVNDLTGPDAPAAERDKATPLTAPVRQDVATNQVTAPDRLVVMLVDDAHIYKERTEKTKELARQVLAKMGPPSAMAVLFTSGEHNTVVTGDPAELLAAIDTAKGRRAIRRPAQAIDVQRPGFLDPEADPTVNSKILEAAGRVDLGDFMNNVTELKTLQEAARLLTAEDVRRKAFVLISEGFGYDQTGIYDTGGPGEDPTLSDSGLAQPQGQPPPSKARYHAYALRQMMDAMWAGHVVTYTLDPRGHVGPDDLARESFPDLLTPALGDDPAHGFRWTSPVRMAQDGLTTMSEASGGFAVTDSDDYVGGIERIAEDVGHYYLLGFSPADPAARGTPSLDVRIPAHPDWKLRFRKSYDKDADKQAAAPSDPRAQLAAKVLPKKDVPLRGFAAALPGSGREARVTMMLGVTEPSQAMSTGDGKLADAITYAVFAVDTKSSKIVKSAGNTAKVMSSTAPPAGTKADIGFQIPIELTLAPGQYQLRFSATSEAMRAGGSVYLTVDVPDFTAKKLAMSGLVLGYEGKPRVALAQPPAESLPVGPRPSPLPVVPSLDRSYSVKDTLRLYAEFTRGRQNSVLATIDVVDEAGRAATRTTQTVPMTAPPQLDVRCPLTGLTAGSYRLRVTLTDDVNTVMREIAFTVK